MSPRPILKRAPSPRADPNPELPFYGINAVHFPRRTSLTHVFDAHSASYYDRSPIIVSPNSCALPERGCPGRTYTLDESMAFSAKMASSGSGTTPKGGHLHPRVLAQYQAQNYSYPSTGAERGSSSSMSSVPPPLIPDLSSESEESDGFISPPPESSSSTHFITGSRTPRSSYSPRVDKYPSLQQYPCDNSNSSSYMAYGTPHPHASLYGPMSNTMPPTTTATGYAHAQPPLPTLSSSPESRNRYRRERERERDHRIRRSSAAVVPAAGDVAADDPGYEDDRDVPSVSSSPTRAPRMRSRGRKSVSRTRSSFSEQDDAGCLGGF